MLGDLPGVKVIVDDILIFGRGESYEHALKDHDENLVRLLERLRENNVKVNPEKMKLRMSEVTYIGHKLTANGLKADSKKTEAIEKMENPTNLSQLKTLLGMINYLAKFIPSLATIAEPLRQLERKDVEWHW